MSTGETHGFQAWFVIATNLALKQSIAAVSFAAATVASRRHANTSIHQYLVRVLNVLFNELLLVPAEMV